MGPASPAAAEPAYEAEADEIEAEFEYDLEAASTAPLIAEELDEPDFIEPSLAQAVAEEEPVEPTDPAMDPFLSPAEVIAATARMMAEFGIEPDTLSHGAAAQALADEPVLPQAEPDDIRLPHAEEDSAWAPEAEAPAVTPEPLPGATFVSQPFVVHSAPAETWSATETYVTTPAHLASAAAPEAPTPRIANRRHRLRRG